MNARQSTFLGSLVLVLAGCPSGQTWETGSVVARQSQALDAPVLEYTSPGRAFLLFDLAGRGLNGQDMNGKVLDGHLVTGVALAGVTLADGRVRNLALQGTSFQGLKAKERVVGARFTATLDDGEALPLRVDSVQAAAAGDDLMLYQVSYPANGGWQPLCGLDAAGAPVLAMPLANRWDYQAGSPTGGARIPDDGAFTFACQGYVLAKCVDMGYRPWVEGRLCPVDGQKKDCRRTSLADHHQACTRMLRADYCGDGTSWTVDGTWVNVYDGMGIRADTENWSLEAEWNADGAVCVQRERVATDPLPACWTDLLQVDCGNAAHFTQGTLLMSEDSTAP